MFVSAKNADLNEGKMHFHDITIEKSLSYWVEHVEKLKVYLSVYVSIRVMCLSNQ